MNGAQGFLLDTSVVLHATRQRSPVSIAIDAQFKLSESRFRPAICEVSVGELLAFSKGWADMSSALKAAGQTIGQNDIWIAATASVAGLTVLTTDKDFLQVRRVTALDVRVLDSNTSIATRAWC